MSASLRSRRERGREPANNEIMAAGMTSVTAEDLFDKGLAQLRALQ